MSTVSLHVPSLATHDTVVTRTVEVYFQKSPVRPNSSQTARGIRNLAWQVMSGGRRIAQGTAGPDGKVIVPIQAGRPSVLQLLVNGNPVANYTITERTAAAEGADTLRGRQRRLRSMGYHLGSGAVDGIMGRATDRSILEFQADESMDMTGVVNGTVQGRITTRAGY